VKNIDTGMHYPLQLDNLPETWEVGYVGDFASVIQPGFASGKHNREGTGIPHLRPMNIDRQGKVDFDVLKYVAPGNDSKRLQFNDVLFNNTNSPALIGKTAVISKPGDWGFSNHMTRISFPETVSSKFAAYQLHFLWMTGYYLHKCVKHVNQASISSKELSKAIPFVVAPFDEQIRIVAEIEKQFSRLDEAVANLKRVKANLKRYKAAVLKAAVEGKLTEKWRKQNPDVESADKLLERILEERRANWQGRGKYKDPIVPDTTGLPELPEGWAIVQLQSLVTLLGDGLHGTPTYTPGTKYYFINGNNLNNGKIEIKPNTKTVSYEELQKHKKILTSNSVLVSINGTLGNVGFYNGEEVMLGKSACYFNLCDTVPKHFIKTILDSPYFMNYAISNATGSTIKNLSLKAMNSFPVPLPPIKEQHQIVAEVERRLSIVSGAEAQVEVNQRRADRLRQSILKLAFSGQLMY
jgi:type I restriction enzyme S subunit